jgi:hypothetical protein
MKTNNKSPKTPEPIVKVSNLSNRKGKLIISRHFILEADENVLREIFTNFFPIDIDRYHLINYWDSILYYGVSPHFDEIEEACVAPEYEIVLKSDKTDKVKFESFKKRDYKR